MEEEIGNKVTRLRRRLSVESDDVKSPSTQSTPTKKRGGRLAAKPQLELIDENASEVAPKRTRKSTARDLAEPVEEKAVTPSRRSIRIRSNTSIVSDTTGEVAEDKDTPPRRTTRVKTNTSHIADPIVPSPRAVRAARRNSQIGSDNEAPTTPTRKTRRTRKDSTSSIDKPAEPIADKLGSDINEVIVEESENNVMDTKSTESSKSDSPSLGKSPGLVWKTARKSTSIDVDNKEIETRSDKVASETTIVADKSLSEPTAEEAKEVVYQKESEQSNLSVTSKNLIKELEQAPKKIKNNLNKSTTAVEEPQIKTKRNRTKSWTTVSVESSHENSFCSDSETSKKTKKKKNDSFNLPNFAGSGDGIMNISNKNEEENKEHENIFLNSSTLSNKKKKKHHEMSMTAETEESTTEEVHEVSALNTFVNQSAAKLSESEAVSKEVNEDVNSLNSSKKHDSSGTQKFFEQAPSGVIQSLVFIEDSDSNHGSIGKQNIDKGFDSGDQCVPVVDHQLEQDETSKEPQTNLSYEPMDIDETMPENVSLPNYVDKNDSLSHKGIEPASGKRRSMLNISQTKNDSTNKSKRKSVTSSTASEGSIDEGSNKSARKTSLSEMLNNDVRVSNKSKRKSSMTKEVSEDTTDGIFNVSKLKSFVVDSDNHDDSINKKSNKSKRNSSKSKVTENNTDDDSSNSARKSINTNMSNDESANKGSNKSKKKSSISTIDLNENTNEICTKSSVSDLANEENMDKILSKSKRKSVSALVAEISMDKIKTSILDPCNDDDTINDNSNKSKRNSSISIMPNNDSIDDKSKNKSALCLDKTENENKSTLVLSQLKDLSENEINLESNVAKGSKEINDQLSKSVNVPNANTEKESDNRNLSLTYSTSTPLQQKSIKKLGLQINSSIIAPNSENKIEKKDTLNRSNQEASMSEDDTDSSEEEEDSEEESSLKKSKLIDDEAEEASDDYESGDSRDEDEKEYEEQNIIVEKGETLDSEDEDEYSDDSDYEKDSFIVSSDEEDKGLLSGSGDDLSMSADELSMSSKSKKKFNERKIKEQKKASREMFEARHKLNESDKSTKSTSPRSKKNNRQRFETSSSESDDEVIAQPKKNRRQRIDSTQDVSTLQSDADKSLSKKKKGKHLSESVCDENETNEKEITIHEEFLTDKIDPLILNIIKEEPKTPQKELNISTVVVTNMDEVEEVNVDENVSIMKLNQTSDPLQATNAGNDDGDNTDKGSISENEEITQNFESVLSNLNKYGSKKIKASNISLDLNKKTKEKAKEPIVDQLNLTHVKKSKKKKADATENQTETKNLDKSLSNKIIDKDDKEDNTLSEDSSDSIDMKLLFPEDSNDSEMDSNKKMTIKKTTQKKDVQEPPEDFIPLKRSLGKTNILENIDIANKLKDESILNVSGKKKNKRKSFQTEENIEMSTQEDNNLGFFIDTTGNLAEEYKADANTSIKNSAKKYKQKNNVSFANIEEAIVNDDSNGAPLEVSYRSEKNKSKQDLNTTQSNEETQADNDAVQNSNQSAMKKKKNKRGVNISQNFTEISAIENTDDVADKSINASVNVTNVEGSTKKKKKRLSESQIDQETDNGDVINEEQITKKRKRKSSANQTIDEILVKDDVKLTKNESLTTNNQKKKLKISNDDEDIKTKVEDSVTETQKQEKTPVENTKKKSKILQYQKVDEIGDEATKKTKKRKERDDDDTSKISKVLKLNSFDKVHVPRLPTNVLKQLEDKPKNDVAKAKKTKVISTSSFVVEQTKTRRNKPSNYLEESVYYMNDDYDGKKQKRSIKNPKVLPFIPTASTSDSGFTTNFKVNIISQPTQFVAQSSDISNFKNDYLHNKRIKKLGTFEMYKRHRNIKISKF